MVVKYSLFCVCIFFARGICLLPEPTPDGCRVLFVYCKRPEAELFVLSDFIKALSMSLDMLLMNSGTFDGLIIIYDMKGFTLSHVGRLGINMMKKYVYFLQVCWLNRMVKRFSYKIMK